MIQLIAEGTERSFNVGKIHHPSGLFLDRATDVDFDSKRMSVEPRALMIRWDVRQTVRGFKSKFLKDVHTSTAFSS